MQLELPNNWMIAVENAMMKVHERFKSDTKYILTESDLKCWLFYELQNQKTYIPYAVHSEVTHFAKHMNEKEELKNLYKFRDLSMLMPSAIIDNEEFLKEGGEKKEILRKGFRHKAPAIHFELKFIRQGNNLNSLETDITKLNGYYPDPENAERKFVVVWGSRCSIKNINSLKEEFHKSNIKITNQEIKPLVEFYLFDAKEMVHLKWDGKNFT